MKKSQELKNNKDEKKSTNREYPKKKKKRQMLITSSSGLNFYQLQTDMSAYKMYNEFPNWTTDQIYYKIYLKYTKVFEFNHIYIYIYIYIYI